MYKNLDRRDFLKTGAAAAMATLMPTLASGQNVSILKRPIPATGELLPTVGFGSSAAVMQILQDGPDLLKNLISTLVGHGASVIDTAPREEAVDDAFGRLLADPAWRDRLFVTSKVGRNRAENINSLDKQGGLEQIRRTARLFRRDMADLIQSDSMIDVDVHWPTLREMKDQGSARYIGITTSNTRDHEKMEAFMRRERPDFIQVNYSLLEPEAGARILPLARDLGIAVIINTPFGGGEYFQRTRGLALPDWAAEFDCTSWAQFNLKYILGEPAVNCILTETTKPRNLEENLLTATGRLPDAAMRTRMKSHIDGVLGTA